MEAREIVRCRGHPHVLGTHPTTFEVTREEHLTHNGNCIIGVAADKGCAGLSPEFRRLLSREDAVLLTSLEVEGIVVEIQSNGSPYLTLDHPTDIVWRRSSFTCGRTIGISSDLVALTLPRDLIERLREGARMTVTLVVTCPG